MAKWTVGRRACVLGATLATSAFACGGTSNDGATGVDASTLDGAKVAEVEVRSAPVAAVRRALAIEPSLVAHFDAARGGLAIDDGALHSTHVDPGLSAPPTRLFARGDAFADAPLVLGVGSAHTWTSGWSLVGAAHAEGVVEDGRLVYADALTAADVVVTAGAQQLETFVVLRAPSAPRELRWHVTRSKGVVGYQPEPTGAIALVDADHLAVVRVAPAFAIDASGKRVDVPMSMDGDDLVLRLDPSGLAYPIVVDPALTTAVWSYRTSSTTGKDTFLGGDPTQCGAATSSCPGLTGCAGGINGPLLAFSPQLGRIVSVGGATDTPCFNTPLATWLDWDSLHGTWLKGPASFAPPATARQGISPAQTSTNLLALFGNTYAGGYAGDSFFHDGSNWYPLCNSTGTGTCYSLSNGAAVTCPKCLGGSPASTTRAYGASGYVDGYFVLFGGMNPTVLGDTCSGTSFPLDCSPSTGSPAGRAWAGFAVDTKRNVLVMYGGSTGSGWTKDTWEWSPSLGWVAKCGTGSLPSCGGLADPSAMTYDPARGVTVLVDQLFQTWEWNGSTWTSTCTSCSVPPRNYTGFAWDTVLNRGVLAGGYLAGSGHYNTDTWEYHVRGNDCAQGCDTGFCVDGVCCEKSVCGSCQACNITSNVVGGVNQVGTCQAVKNADDPDSCPSTTSTCDGTGTCRSKLGISCSATTDCASGNCVASTTGSVCCASSSCAVGQICQIGTGQCIGALGYACTSSAQCASGNCVDGVCCDSPCDPTQPCQSCNNAGHVGHCTLTVGAPTTGRGTCPISASTDAACKQATCSGSDATQCHYPGGTTTCTSGAKCASGTESDPIGCNGKGDCGFSTKACNNFGCNASGTACNTTCAVDTDCAAGYFCQSGACVVRETQGTPCSSTNQCAPGLTCVSGVCCGSSSCPNGTCNGSHPGTCTWNNGQACTAGSQCTSSNCYDSVCCGSACGGQCQSCAEGGSVGTCVTVTGAPRNGRPACTAKSSDPTCGPTSCDGGNPSACTAPTGSTTCGAASCASGTASFTGKCDGSGTCLTPPTIACAPYGCGATACKTACAADTDCISGYFCSGTTCVQKRANGLACTAADQCVSNACVDGVCCSSASCAGGAKCNLAGYAGTCMIAQGNACTSGAQCTTGWCVDGVCCNAACTGQCEACDGGGGICAAVSGAPRNGRPACVNASGDPSCSTAACNGSLRTACSLPSGNVCGGGCSGGVATTTGACDGTGACAGSQKLACAPYACGATACKTTCTGAGDCATGNYCDASGHCAALLATGTTCSAPSQCQSGNCVDGVCCGSASCPQGGVCNDPSHLGACVIQTGQACVAGTPCSTGSCVDGYCCNTSCTGQCEACDVPGLLGVCSPVPAKQQPHGTRTACTNVGTDPICSVASCDGTTRKSCSLPDSSVGCGQNTCSGGVFTSAGTCTGGGACRPATGNGCAPYICGASACLSSCTGDADCTAGFYCDATGHCAGVATLGKPCASDSACGAGLACVDNVCCNAPSCPNGTCNASPSTAGQCRTANGNACKVDGECASGHCVDGVCCNSACTDQCAACDNVGSVGVCTPVIGAPHGGRLVCASDGTTCGTTSCDGVNSKACAFPTTSTACGAQSCATGVETDPGRCDASGGCTSTTRACGTFLCDAAACKTKCQADADCVSTAYCDASGSCQLRGKAGTPCDATKANACGDGLGCQDGVCCQDPSCDANGGFCAGDHPGVCLKVNDSACTSDADCNSGHCVEKDATGAGVCCDTACDGTCETCRDASAPGTCIPVRGAPAAGHGSCPAGTGDVCSGSVCDGKGRKSCDGKPGKETICQPASCATGKFNPDISCDGSGKCPTVTPAFCDNFRTCTSATSCAQGPCTADADCVDGYACDAPTGKCRPRAAHCKDGDPTTAVDAQGHEQSCVPFLCDASGSCKSTCAKSEDCAGGYVCDTNALQCVSPDTQAGSAANAPSGCDASGGAPSKAGLALFALAAAVGMRRARRRR